MGKFIAGAVVGGVAVAALFMAEIKQNQAAWQARYDEMAVLICELPLSIRIERAPALVCPVQKR